jgi:hypothetical protein
MNKRKLPNESAIHRLYKVGFSEGLCIVCNLYCLYFVLYKMTVKIKSYHHSYTKSKCKGVLHRTSVTIHQTNCTKFQRHTE